jgi:multiple sugar transport system permease protein
MKSGRHLDGYPKLAFRRSPLERSLFAGLTPAMVILFVVSIFPLTFLALVSLTSFNLARPETWTDFSKPLAGFQRLAQDERFFNSLIVQAKLSFFTVTFQVNLGLIGALLLNFKTRFISLIRMSLLIPMVLPPIVAAIIWKVLFTASISPINWILGLLGLPQPIWLATGGWALTAIIIADVWKWFPYALLSILAALQIVPDELLDAAKVDGASSIQSFWHITLPIISPTLFVVVLFQLIDSIKAFPSIFVLTQGGPGIATEPTNFYAYQKGFSLGLVGYSSTMAIVMLVICFLLSLAIASRSNQEVGID